MNNDNNVTWTPPDKGCMPAHIRKWAPPQCPVKAVIPLVEVATPENLKTLSNCFAYVQSTNTTFYIDNQHKFIMCWAGPIFADNYDYTTNPLGIHGQFVPDFANSQLIVYNEAGEYLILNGSQSPSVETISDDDWTALWA